MKLIPVILGTAVFLTACGGGPSFETGPVSGPAPVGALECALRFMGEAGYRADGGGVGNGFIDFRQIMSGGFMNTEVRWREVTVTVAAGQMRVTASVEQKAQHDARAVLAACSTSNLSAEPPSTELNKI